jgi:BASS family bile acid:Na+ symporter
MQAGLLRTVALLLALLLGVLLPQAHAVGWLIKWIVGAMLFVTFLGMRPGRGTLGAGHARLLAANVAMAFAALGLGWLAGGREVGLAAFFAGLAPTAIAAPAVIGFLGGRADFVTGAVLLSNVAVAALMPLLLPLVLGKMTVPVRFADVLGSVALVVFLPAGVAAVVRRLRPVAQAWPGRLRNAMFGAWAAAMFLAMANASEFLHTHDVDRTVLAKIAAVTAAVCVANFALGRRLAGRGLEREGSQALGQKNTAFCIAMATAHATPLVALGPTCYVLWHNLWNSWQLHQAGRRAAADKAVETQRAQRG